MQDIHLAPGLSVPNSTPPAAAQRYAFVGLPGSGKSNAAAVLIEGLLT